VLAIVPHYRCEAWLGQCLRSLTRQTRPPQAIVVVDDASPSPPLAEVAPFAGVTLLAAAENVGPYRLLQSVIERTAFDAYMLQDADDWSSDDRLSLLLRGAERTGAELIGCQELRFDTATGFVAAHFYPPDAGHTLRTHQLQAILHPSSLVSRSLVSRIGGFAAGLRFGGDLDFQLRAHHVARAVNVGRFCYFRRRREGSLWTAPDTGRYSPARRQQEAAIEARAAANAERVARGQAPDLEPYRRADPVPLVHLAGPPLP
jgi:glycosyltransferase involved in cell wall biosynthesis